MLKEAFMVSISVDGLRKSMYSHQDVRYVDHYSITRQPEDEVGIFLTHYRVVRKAGATSSPFKMLFRSSWSHVDLLHEGILF
jgi:hypothetical protein